MTEGALGTSSRREGRKWLGVKIALAVLGVAIWVYVIATRAPDDLRGLRDEFLWGAVAMVGMGLAQLFIVGPLMGLVVRARLKRKVTIEWTEIAGLRERDEQVDLVDDRGKKVGWIDIWDPEAPTLLRRVVGVTNRLRPPEFPIPGTVPGYLLAGQPAICWLIYLIILGLSVWMVIDGGAWSVLAMLLALILFTFLVLESAHILRLELRSDELVLHFPWKARRVLRSQAEVVTIEFERLESGAHRLVTRLHVAEGKPIEITPNGTDPLAAYRAASVWLYARPGAQ